MCLPPRLYSLQSTDARQPTGFTTELRARCLSRSRGTAMQAYITRPAQCANHIAAPYTGPPAAPAPAPSASNSSSNSSSNSNGGGFINDVESTFNHLR